MTPTPVQFSRRYGFVRSRQLDGTFPGDAQTGVWGSTVYRVARGWGEVPEDEWPHLTNSEPWPPVEPPGLDERAKRYRILYYQRITDWYECKVAIASGWPVNASFEITKQWDHAENGVIELPPEGAEIIGSHSVRLVGYSDEEERFRFANCWGREWGDGGFGYLPYEFFETWLIEAWISGGVGQAPPGQMTMTAGIEEIRWGIPDFAGRIFHAREFHDTRSDERMAWTFAVQNQDYLDVEELFVRPQYRRQGYGTRLLQSLGALSTEVRLPLRFFIPFADCTPQNLSVVERLLSKEGYYLFPGGMRWSQLVALRPVGVHTLSLRLPAPPALRSPRARLAGNGLILPAINRSDFDPGERVVPVSESTELLKQPDWKSGSDKAFLAAAKATFHQHASLLRRLA
jgi:GNAT superfamily N-acetyltransferase